MERTLLILLFATTFLSGIVLGAVAGSPTATDSTITLPSEQKNTLVSAGYTQLSTKEIGCTSNQCTYLLLNAGEAVQSFIIETTGLTNQQIAQKRDEVIRIILKQKAEAIKAEQDRTQTKLGDGSVTLR